MSLFFKRKNGTLILDRKEFKSFIRKILGFKPGNLQIYETALIHRSASVILPDGKRINNERLEFLGDSILSSILSDWVFEKYPGASEGRMTKLRSKIANREVINQLAVKMGINNQLVSKLPPSNNSRSLYGNALEALIGAIFIDKGYDRTKKFFIKRVMKKYLDVEMIIRTDNDYKSLIFEWTQKKKLTLSFVNSEDYDFKSKKSLFSSKLIINGQEYGTGKGLSKKEAEQEAACMAWEKTGKISE